MDGVWFVYVWCGGDLLDSHLLLHSDGDNDTIALSVYFHQATMVKYRTDVVLDWLDLIGWCETFSLCFLFVYVCVCFFSLSVCSIVVLFILPTTFMRKRTRTKSIM